MKKILIILTVMFLLPLYGFAEETATAEYEIIDEYAQMYGEELIEGVESLEGVELDSLVPGFNVQEIISGLAKGENIFSIREIYNKGIMLLTGEVKSTLKILVFILALAILSTYLVNIQSSLNNDGAANAAFFACYTVIAGIAAAAFFEVIRCGQTVIENIALFMRVIVPVALVSLMSSGAVITATTFEATLMGVIEITEWIIETVFIPLLLMAAAINIVNNLSEKLNAEKIVQTINKTVKWGLSILLTIFVWVTGLQGIAAGGADGLTVKVTKFAAANLIPVVGGILSESVETVMNCSVVIKNSVGIVGIILVALISVVPVIKVAACLIMFRICAAVIQPIADKKIVKCISEMADSVSCVFSMMVAVIVMFIIILTIVINIGNTAALLGR